MRGTESSWLLVRTQPRREQFAQSNVERWSGKATYLPLFLEDGKPKVLFPSYLFVFSDEWYFLKGAWGVSQIIMVGNEPARIPDSEIAKLRAKEQNHLVVLPQLEYQPGDPVEVKAGPFAGFDGLYQGMNGSNRVRVLLDVFNRKTEVEIDRPDVVITRRAS